MSKSKKNKKSPAVEKLARSVVDDGRAHDRVSESLVAKRKSDQLAGPLLAAMVGSTLSEKPAWMGALGSVSSLFDVKAGVASPPGAATGSAGVLAAAMASANGFAGVHPAFRDVNKVAGAGSVLAMAASASSDRFLAASKPLGSSHMLGALAGLSALSSVSSMFDVKAEAAVLPGLATGSMSALAATAGPALSDRSFSAWTVSPEKMSLGWAGAVSAVAGLVDGKFGTGAMGAGGAGAGSLLAAMVGSTLSEKPAWMGALGSVSSLFDVKAGVASPPGAATGSAGVLAAMASANGFAGLHPAFRDVHAGAGRGALFAAMAGSTLSERLGALGSVSSLFDVKAGVSSTSFRAVEAVASALAAQQDSYPRTVSESLNSTDFSDVLLPQEDVIGEPTEIIRMRVPVGLRRATPSLLLLVLLQLGTVMQIGAPQWLDSLGKIFGFAVDGLEIYLILRVLWHLDQRD